jgi:hypothetical protein
MYLSVWSETPWPDEIDNMADFEEAFHSITATPENFGAIFRRNLFDERTEKKNHLKNPS